MTKEGIKFSASGDIGSANIICRQNTQADKQARVGMGRGLVCWLLQGFGVNTAIRHHAVGCQT